jgi:hypothetical protein
MSDFRTKLFGLVTFATLFTGLSYGQVTCTGVVPTINPTSPILVRAESEADLVSDVTFTCPNSAVVANGQLTVFASLPITSKVVTGATTSATFVANGNSEALLTITNNVGGAQVVYQGTVSGSVLSFTGVNYPANFTALISNVRVNATGAAVGSTPVAITESIFAGSNGLATYVQNGVTVGYALKSLVNPAFTVNGSGFPTTNNTYVVCTGNSAASNAPSLSFTVIAAETFGGFFKTQTGNGVIQNGEQGSVQNGASAAIGTAASGTQISFALTNVPSVATVYVPTTITYTPAGGVPATLTLNPTQTAVTTPAGAAAIPLAANGFTYGGFAGFTPSSNALTITYQVTASSSAQVESFQVPFYVAFAANAAAAQGPITVLESYAPASVLTGQATSIPTFAPSANTPLNASAINLCQTTLLFPFVTNQLGFDTGIVVANTSTDTLGTGGKSLATAQAGTCSLAFFGAGAPTPATGVVDPQGSTASGSTHAFLLSSVAPGFQGYAIASCPFLYAHGYAFLEYNLTQSNGVVEGYIAEVLTRAGGQAPEGVTF